MSAKNKRGGQEGALVKMLDRQRVQKAAVDAAKKLEDEQSKPTRQRGECSIQ